MKKIKKKDTFNFFNYKWKKVPTWSIETEKKYINWYLVRYQFKKKTTFKNFLSNKMNLLEVGCGLARDSKFFSELNPKALIYAVDQSDYALNIAKKNLKKYKNINFLKADFTKKLKLKIKFDFISCDQALHHTPEPTKTLNNLYNMLSAGGYLNFSFCRKKNKYRDFVDDLIMNHSSNLSPSELWEFSHEVTKFGKALYSLDIKNLKFNKKFYPNIQNFVHNQIFRCWYDPNIKFQLSVSSNYDWFSNNPRFSLSEVKKIMKEGLGKHKLISIYEDDASISCRIKKTD